jgi:hypothetical protein
VRRCVTCVCHCLTAPLHSVSPHMVCMRVCMCVCVCVCVGFKYALKLDKQAEEQKRVTEGQGVSASK